MIVTVSMVSGGGGKVVLFRLNDIISRLGKHVVGVGARVME